MQTSAPRPWTSWLLLAVLVGSWAVFAARMFKVEPDLAVSRARERLAAQASEGAYILVQAGLNAQADPEAAPCRFRGGRCVFPVSPSVAGSLGFVTGRDSVGEFYIQTSAQKEQIGDLSEAIRLLRVAGDEDRDPDLAMVALARIPALLRRGGDEAAAVEAAVEAVRRLGATHRLTREGLLLRAQVAVSRRPSGEGASEGRVSVEGRIDDDLVDDLCRMLGGRDEAIARGLLDLIGIGPEDFRLASREAELARVARARLAMERFEPPGVPTHRGMVLVDDLAVLASEDGDEVVVVEMPVPTLPDGVAFRSHRHDPGHLLVERMPVFGDHVMASESAWPVREAGRVRALRWSAGAALLAIVVWLAWRQTRRAWERERESSEARARFLERIGHDLRTPLALIRMYAETLEAGRVNDPGEAKEFAGIAAREAARLSGVVEDVMDLSRVASLEDRRRDTDLRDLAESVVSDQFALFRGQEREVRADLPVGPVWVSADPDALRGAVGNLLENAWRHGEGAVRLRLHTERGRAILAVTDQGKGLVSGDENRVFDRFARGTEATGKGGGLGLALVREVCESMGGSARYRASDESRGPSFVMELPCHDRPTEPATPNGAKA